MTVKIITLIVLFALNFWGLFALLATVFNLPFKLVFGAVNKTHGNKKLYWIGHLLLVALIFFLWYKLTSTKPTLVLVLVLCGSTLLSMITTSQEKLVMGNNQIHEANMAKSAFAWNVTLFYIILLIGGKISFLWW